MLLNFCFGKRSGKIKRYIWILGNNQLEVPVVMLLKRAGHLWNTLLRCRCRAIRNCNGSHLIIFAH